MTDLFTKKDMVYGGRKPADYYVLYEHANSGKMFKSLADARKYAIEYSIRMHKNGQFITNRDGNYYDVENIYARLFYKHRPDGTSLTYSQQSGKTKYAGHVYIVNPTKVYWRPNNKKDSAWLDKSGRVKRKMTRKEIEAIIW